MFDFLIFSTLEETNLTWMPEKGLKMQNRNSEQKPILISNLFVLWIVSVSHEKNKQMDLSTVHRLLATVATDPLLSLSVGILNYNQVYSMWGVCALY